MDKQNKREDALFEELGRNKKRRRRKILITVLVVILVIAIVLVAAVSILRQRVRTQFGGSGEDVLSYAAATGTLHTLVSGSGVLEEVDLETISVPTGVEIREIEVSRNQTVKKGDILATVDMSTVMQALADTQSAIDDLDDQISDAEGSKVSSTIKAGVSGRVKAIHSQKGDDVTATMARHGALAVLSLDGWMAVDLEAEGLKAGDTLLVRLADGTEETGEVESVLGNSVTVLVSDETAALEEQVTVLTEEGVELGTGALYIHRPLRITGYAGTVSNVSAKLNQKVSANTTVFTLTNTSFSTSYETLLRDREDQEEILRDLLVIYQDGAVLAPYDGLVSAVLYSEDEETTTTTASTAQSLYGGYGMGTTTAATEETDTTESTELLSLTPNEKVSVTISIGEADILSLKEGQSAEITISSVSEEEVFEGTVTEVSKTADSSSGVTQYSAVVELEKNEAMLAGMSAKVGIRIEGVENAILVPVDAVHQTRDIAYVYTSYDPETSQYGGMVEVETGLWGDEYVEIISGLQVGDTVYYTEQQSMWGGFGNMDFGGMNMPGGMGNMPSGMGDMPGGRNNMPSGSRNNMPGGRG